MQGNLSHRTRPGFTLIEILVVLAIIAILVGLSGAAYFYWVGSAQEKTTRATIETAMGVVKKQWAAVIKDAKSEPIPDALRAAAAPDSTGDERAKVMLIMLRLAEAFPQSFAEITSPPTSAYGLKPKYSAIYQGKIAGKPGGDPKIESSGCTYIALTTAKGGHALETDKLPTKSVPINASNGLPDQALGVPVLVDGFGHPIAFFRFPYSRVAGSVPKLEAAMPVMTGPVGSYKNPLDPMRKLEQTWSSAAARTTFENYVRFEIGDWYTTPVLVSAGRNEVLDLTFVNAARNFPDMSPTSNLANDNLYSLDIVAP